MSKFNYKIIVCVCLLIAFPSTVISRSETNSEIIRNLERPPYATYNECGGYIQAKLDQTIVLEYKLNEEYENDEFCVWEIRNDECYATLYTKTESGFEVGYDYLQISEVSAYYHQVTPTYHDLMGNTTGIEQANTRSEINYVIFSTDYSNTGTGFRLEIIGYSERSNARWHDDFMSFSPIGTTTMKPYHDHMFQSFVIIPKLKSVPSLELNIEYMTDRFWDKISVYSMERNGKSVRWRQHSRELSGNGSATFETVYYTNFLVFFHVEFSGPTPEYGSITLNWQTPNGNTTD